MQLCDYSMENLQFCNESSHNYVSRIKSKMKSKNVSV